MALAEIKEPVGQRRLPNFVIVGAMKSGTTTLYNILQSHPDIFMPRLEIGFFDIDDIGQHPDFFRQYRGKWYYHNYGTCQLRDWYTGFFAGAEDGQLVGERSTSYMASLVAPRRMRELVPDVKLIFMLRDPVSRAYSNYWHLLRSGEVTQSFENALRYRTKVLFDRGLYREQVKRYMDVFPRDQLLFLVFEEFIARRAEVVEEVYRFLGVDAGKTVAEVDAHENRGRYPWSISLQYLANWVLFKLLGGGQRYTDAHLPRLTSTAMDHSEIRRCWERAVSLASAGMSKVNCSRRTAPKMRGETRSMLTSLYETRNEGLSEMIGRRLDRWWDITNV